MHVCYAKTLRVYPSVGDLIWKIGKHKGKPIKDIDTGYMKWYASVGDDHYHMCLVNVWLDSVECQWNEFVKNYEDYWDHASNCLDEDAEQFLL